MRIPDVLHEKNVSKGHLGRIAVCPWGQTHLLVQPTHFQWSRPSEQSIHGKGSSRGTLR